MMVVRPLAAASWSRTSVWGKSASESAIAVVEHPDHRDLLFAVPWERHRDRVTGPQPLLAGERLRHHHAATVQVAQLPGAEVDVQCRSDRFRVDP